MTAGHSENQTTVDSKPTTAEINPKLIQLTDDEPASATKQATSADAVDQQVEETPISEYRLTAKLIAGNTIDPMIGMAGTKLA